MYREYKPTCIEHLFANNRKSNLKGKYISVKGRKILFLENVPPCKYNNYYSSQGQSPMQLSNGNHQSRPIRKRKNYVSNNGSELYYLYKNNSRLSDSDKSEDYCVCSRCQEPVLNSSKENLVEKIKRVNHSNSSELYSNGNFESIFCTCETDENSGHEDLIDSKDYDEPKQKKFRLQNEKTYDENLLKNKKTSCSKFNVNYLRRLCYITCMKALLKSSKKSQPVSRKNTESQTENYDFYVKEFNYEGQQNISKNKSTNCRISTDTNFNRPILSDGSDNFIQNNPFIDVNKLSDFQIDLKPVPKKLQPRLKIDKQSQTEPQINYVPVAIFRKDDKASEGDYAKTEKCNPFLYDLNNPMITSPDGIKVTKKEDHISQIFKNFFMKE